jgi:hypothetical protein
MEIINAFQMYAVTALQKITVAIPVLPDRWIWVADALSITLLNPVTTEQMPFWEMAAHRIAR